MSSLDTDLCCLLPKQTNPWPVSEDESDQLQLFFQYSINRIYVAKGMLTHLWLVSDILCPDMQEFDAMHHGNQYVSVQRTHQYTSVMTGPSCDCGCLASILRMLTNVAVSVWSSFQVLYLRAR